ncbi:hypothetical protein O7632_06890 [Solwaraspora sp. WMMD406]|uniref:hypothetical protein n=1 Tax=Solwaraspora sp. WMMD406 TaxID=3016095 RepID=UPI002415A2F9|nr:hypothetical protein [Solwaraspora sp. WMMD406]MDG4763836.1 hypothetical protein [Solwaraspora sp. WMMD406]
MSDQSTSIDDLLYHEEEPPARDKPRRGGLVSWLTALLIAAAGTAVLVFGLRMLGLAVPVVAVFAGCLALVLLRRILRSVTPPPPIRLRRVGADPEDGSYVFTSQDGLLEAVRRWEHQLRGAQHDATRFTETVLPLLGELADERLRQRHGLTRASDPDRARVILGEHLWDFLDTRTRRKPSVKDCAMFVGQLERI